MATGIIINGFNKEEWKYISEITTRVLKICDAYVDQKHYKPNILFVSEDIRERFLNMSNYVGYINELRVIYKDVLPGKDRIGVGYKMPGG